MTIARLVYRSLCFYARLHVGTLLGAAVGSAVLIGALVVGDSVRGTLRAQALSRLGRVELALASGDRLFRSQLGADVQVGLRASGFGQGRVWPVVPVLQLPAVATAADGGGRANRVRVLGVDLRFWVLGLETPPFITNLLNVNNGWQLTGQAPAVSGLPQDGVALNEPLARQLGVKIGDAVLLRVQKPSQFSRDAPLSPEENSSVALRLKVHAIVTERQFGRFSLQANQAPPLNAFVSLPLLQEKSGVPGRANMLLLARPSAPSPASARSRLYAMPEKTAEEAHAVAQAVLRLRWQLEDGELELRELPEWRAIELRTSRVFLDSPVADAAFGRSNSTPVDRSAAVPTGALRQNSPVPPPPTPSPQVDLATFRPSGVLAYLVNELRVGTNSTPYSMVAAVASPIIPMDLADGEILISQWLADDLACASGDVLSLTYYVVGAMRQLEERSAPFRVRAVLPTNAPALDRNLMPDYPGLANSKSCKEWDAGLPIDTARIRPKDEQYWTDYRGTPKAFITLAAGQQLWRNRFGDLTAVRFHPQGAPAAAGTPTPAEVARWLAAQKEAVRQALMARLDPAAVGLYFQPVRAQAAAASADSQDFGQLFLGFSFFLIVAALLLMSVLFQFSIERRAGEVGTLLALGFTPRKTRRVFLLEGGALALVGGLLGALGGVWYARAMLHGLSTIWSGAIGGAELQHQASASTLAIGIAFALAVTMLTMWLALRRLGGRQTRELLAEGHSAGKSARSGWLAVATGLGAVSMAGYALLGKETANAGLFFGSGALLLVSGLASCSWWLTALATGGSSAHLSVSAMGVRGATRRRKRTLATIALLACGTFLIASISIFRLEPAREAGKRASGTGGFTLIGESTQPVIHDLNSARGLDAYGIAPGSAAGVRVVPFRVRDGDEASCLNLNRAQTPRLLGVRPELLQERGAFKFAQACKGASKEDGWMLLKRRDLDDAIPAIGDQASVQWALGKKVGDVLTLADERGRAFKVRLVGAVANSILQGNLVIAEDEFVTLFPSAGGYRMFLIDAPADAVERVSTAFTRALKDLGLELTPTETRLSAFNAVQNTYLGAFQALGGLGLVLGTVGLGVVVLRNVLERRGELALLLAVGFRRSRLRWLILCEHAVLLVGGLAVGVVSALVAVLPSVAALGVEVPYPALCLILGGIVVNGALWTWLAAEVALRGNLLDSLRDDAV